MAQDIKLTQDTQNTYDIDFADGDFELTDGLDTALLLSVFGEQRASAAQIPDPLARRGHFTNLFNIVDDYEVGCFLWLLTEQQRNTDANLSLIEETVLNDGLQWMIDDDILKTAEVNGTRESDGITLGINVTNQTQQDSRYYDIFINTFN
jgi:phage gp46-like protein